MEIPSELPALRLLPSRKAPERFRTFVRRAVAWSVWLYLLFVVGVWLLLYLSGDRWWFATMILFGPRWLLRHCRWSCCSRQPRCLRRRLLWPLAASAMVVVWPIMGLCLPVGRLAAPAGDCVRVLTFNVDGKSVDREALHGLIEQEQPDVVALQECRGRQPLPVAARLARAAPGRIAGRVTVSDPRS